MVLMFLRISVKVNFSGKCCNFTKFRVETWLKRVLNKQSYFGAFCKKSQKCRKIAKKSPRFFMFFLKNWSQRVQNLKIWEFAVWNKDFHFSKEHFEVKNSQKSRQSRQNGDLCAPTPPCFSNQAKTASWRHCFCNFEAFLLQIFQSN